MPFNRKLLFCYSELIVVVVVVFFFAVFIAVAVVVPFKAPCFLKLLKRYVTPPLIFEPEFPVFHVNG